MINYFFNGDTELYRCSIIEAWIADDQVTPFFYIKTEKPVFGGRFGSLNFGNIIGARLRILPANFAPRDVKNSCKRLNVLAEKWGATQAKRFSVPTHSTEFNKLTVVIDRHILAWRKELAALTELISWYEKNPDALENADAQETRDDLLAGLHD